MRVGVGLPTSTLGADGPLLLEWSRRSEAGPFSSLGVVDRVRYHCWEPLTALGAAAAVTARLRLVTMILIGPLRATALLAKQAATLHALSGGRLVLGLGIGARHDDYQLSGVDHRTRGRRLSQQLAAIAPTWEAGGIGPALSSGRPTLLVGGGGGQAFWRAASLADGYVR